MIHTSNPVRNRFNTQSSNTASLRSSALKVSTITPRNHQPLSPTIITSPTGFNSKYSHRFNFSNQSQQFSSTPSQSSPSTIPKATPSLNKTYEHTETPSAYSILSNGGIKRRPTSSLVSKRNTDMFGTYYTNSDDKSPKYPLKQDINKSFDLSFDYGKERSKSQPRSIRKILPPLSQPKQEEKPKVVKPSSKLEKSSSIKNLVSNFFKSKQKINASTSDIGSHMLNYFETDIVSIPESLSKNDIEYESTSSEEERYERPTMSYLLGHGKNRGLKNIGNTCFMNSTLQCLCSIQPIREYFSTHLKINPKKEGNLAKQFSALLRSLTSGDSPYTPVNPIDFKRTLNQYTSLFRGYDQQDSQEFLRYVLDGLSEDTNRIIEKPKYVELEEIANENVFEKSNRWFRNYIERSNSFVTDLFLGQLKSEIKCCACGRKSVTFDPFLDVCLPINLKRGHKSYTSYDRDVSLEECLMKFTEEEYLGGIEQVYCSSCKKHQDTLKVLSFFRVPEVLVVQLKRFSNDQKLLDQVHLCELLEFGNYLSPEAAEKIYNNQPITYQLMGVIKHFGSLRGGHYISQVKNAEGEWIEYNDSAVKNVHHFNTNDSSAYVLFYGRIKGS